MTKIEAPPERLATFRIVLGIFVTGYLLVRSPVFVELGHRSPGRFDAVGIFRVIGQPIPHPINSVVVAATIVAGALFTVGWRFRVTGPVFALGLLIVATHRSSWGQLLHFENLMTLHVIVVAFARSADAWSLDALRRAHTRVEVSGPHSPADRPPIDRYGHALHLAALTTVITYVIAGVAKLRYGGFEWMDGDTLRNHIAYSATRLELLGERRPPLAVLAVEHSVLLRPAGVASVAIELLAPLALLGGRWRNGWVIVAWLMHVGIFATMLVGFPSPLFLVAFAPMFALERVVLALRRRT